MHSGKNSLLQIGCLFGNKNYAPLLEILTSYNFKFNKIPYQYRKCRYFYVCLHFHRFMKMGNFACIKIRDLSITASLGYHTSNF